MELESLRELCGYRWLYATTNLLLLCVFLIWAWAYFSLDLTHNTVPVFAVAVWALFTLAYHGLLPDRRFTTWRMLFYGNISVREARAKVEGFSRVDWLTGLYDRRHFDSLLAQEVGRAARYNRPLTPLNVDWDNLKVVNDTYGHQAGDHLIAMLANSLRAEMRLSDTLVRYGGDEFVVLLPDTEPIGARFLAERLRGAVESAELTWQKQRIPITVTIGVASLPAAGNDGTSLVARADAALYAGKRAGRNRVVTASEAAAAAADTGTDPASAPPARMGGPDAAPPGGPAAIAGRADASPASAPAVGSIRPAGPLAPAAPPGSGPGPTTPPGGGL